jgi:ankyrin repeat protein
LPAIDFIQMLLENGADPNIRIGSGTVLRNVGDPRWLREAGATPFLRAAISGDLPVMRLLLAYGADPTITTLDKTTALMAASGVGWAPGVNQEISESVTVEAVQLLLDLGMDVKAANGLGITALHGAASKGANAVVRVLVDHGADLTKGAKAPYLGQKFELIPLDFAVGVPLNVLAPIGHSDTVELLRKLMTEKGIPILKNSRQPAIDNTVR